MAGDLTGDGRAEFVGCASTGVVVYGHDTYLDFGYNADGIMASATISDTGGVTTTTYVGDHQEWVGSKPTNFYFHNGRRVAMTVDGGHPIYLHAARQKEGKAFLLLSRLARPICHRHSNTSGDTTSGTQYYYPYGEMRGGSEVATDYRYTGQRWQSALGLYYYRARWYDPAMRRFIQADTIVPEPGNPQTLNRYSYVYNNPIRYSDPTGHLGDPDRDRTRPDGTIDTSMPFNPAHLSSHPDYKEDWLAAHPGRSEWDYYSTIYWGTLFSINPDQWYGQPSPGVSRWWESHSLSSSSGVMDYDPVFIQDSTAQGWFRRHPSPSDEAYFVYYEFDMSKVPWDSVMFNAATLGIAGAGTLSSGKTAQRVAKGIGVGLDTVSAADGTVAWVRQADPLNAPGFGDRATIDLGLTALGILGGPGWAIGATLVSLTMDLSEGVSYSVYLVGER